MPSAYSISIKAQICHLIHYPDDRILFHQMDWCAVARWVYGCSGLSVKYSLGWVWILCLSCKQGLAVCFLIIFLYFLFFSAVIYALFRDVNTLGGSQTAVYRAMKWSFFWRVFDFRFLCHLARFWRCSACRVIVCIPQHFYLFLLSISILFFCKITEICCFSNHQLCYESISKFLSVTGFWHLLQVFVTGLIQS